MRSQDVPYTRADVTAWLSAYDGEKADTPELRDYLAGKLGELAETEVDTQGNDSLEDTTALVDLIIMDLPSYA